MDDFIGVPVYSEPVLRGRLVFLSASFAPLLETPGQPMPPSPFEVTDAVLAVTRAVLGAGGQLLYGGHPTISPLVLSVARDFVDFLPEKPFVHIYQSQLFHDRVREETLELERAGGGKIYWVEATADELDEGARRRKSLRRMRDQMLQREPVAAIFLGGGVGVYTPGDPECEFSLFKALHKGRPVYPLKSTGGAAALLWDGLSRGAETTDWWFKSLTLQDLGDPTPYTWTMRTIVSDIAGHL